MTTARRRQAADEQGEELTSAIKASGRDKMLVLRLGHIEEVNRPESRAVRVSPHGSVEQPRPKKESRAQ